MKFQEIFQQPGLYKTNDFFRGTALKVSIYNHLTLIYYLDPDSSSPFREDYPCITEKWFEWDFEQVSTVQSLFD